MKSKLQVGLIAAVLSLTFASPALLGGRAEATIHPIVESYDCANENAFEHHPLGDPAEPPGQTPGVGSHSDQSTFRALQESNDNAWFGHKLNGECGTPQNP